MSQTMFEFFTGIHFTQIKDRPHPPEKWQWRGTCPFCHTKDHFFYGPGPDFMWDCKKCMLKGNAYTFLKHVHQDICNDDLVSVLAMERGISHQYFIRNKIKYNPSNNSFVIPTFNKQGTLNYLYKVAQVGDKKQIFNCPGLDATLFNWDAEIKDTVWLVEGLWDKMAAEDIIGNRNITVIGFPGSGFKGNWCGAFAGKDLVIFVDNDEAGTKHLRTITDRVSSAPHKPTSVKQFKLPTPDAYPKGFDVNDILIKYNHDAFTFIDKNIVDLDIQGSVTATNTSLIADPSCKTFDHLTTGCKEPYHFTDDMAILVHLLITSVYALKIEGEQLWVRVIGPPGSSKTTIATLVGSSDQTVMRSTFTGLLSGWKDDNEQDASMIPTISGKALIVKDADALLQQPNKEQIFSELRDFYDKSISVSFRNRVEYAYNDIRSAFIFCGTHALRGMDNSALGERFVDFELRVSEEDRNSITDKMLDRSIEAGISGVNPENKVHAMAKNFIDNIVLNYEGVSAVGTFERGLISEYSKLIAYMRAKVNRNRVGEIMYKPFAEIPSRLTGQFTKLYQCGPVVLGHKKADDQTHKMVRRVAMDVIDRNSHRFAIAHIMCKAEGQSLNQLVEMTGLSIAIASRELDDMRELNMLNIKKMMIGTNTAIHIASLKPHLNTQMRLITEGENL